MRNISWWNFSINTKMGEYPARNVQYSISTADGGLAFWHKKETKKVVEEFIPRNEKSLIFSETVNMYGEVPNMTPVSGE